MTVSDELNEIKELVNNDKHFKYKNIVNFNCESIEKFLKALEIIKEHIKFEDSGIETYTDYLKNLVTKFMIRLESKDTGATFHIHLDTKEEFDILKAVLE